MRLSRLGLVPVVVVMLGGNLGAAQTPGPATPAEVRQFTMTARRYQFDPSVITVKKGQLVRLIITAADRNHGFKLEEFGINQLLKKNQPAIIEFTASKAGTFIFRCSEFCGLGHAKMKGKLVVEE